MSQYLQMLFDKFELRVRKGYYYTDDGVWVSVEKGRIRVGVSDYVQRTSGDVAFVELVKPGATFEKRGEMGTIETAKTTVSVLSPVSGTVEEINGLLAEKPELVNSDPYGEGWLAAISPCNLDDDLKTLMSADTYFELMLEKLEMEHKKLESS